MQKRMRDAIEAMRAKIQAHSCSATQTHYTAHRQNKKQKESQRTHIDAGHLVRDSLFSSSVWKAWRELPQFSVSNLSPHVHVVLFWICWSEMSAHTCKRHRLTVLCSTLHQYVYVANTNIRSARTIESMFYHSHRHNRIGEALPARRRRSRTNTTAKRNKHICVL